MWLDVATALPRTLPTCAAALFNVVKEAGTSLVSQQTVAQLFLQPCFRRRHKLTGLDGEISQSYTQSDPETHRALGSGASFFWRSEALEVSGCVKSKPQKKVDRLKSKRLEEFLWTVSQKRGRCQKRKLIKKEEERAGGDQILTALMP